MRCNRDNVGCSRHMNLNAGFYGRLISPRPQDSQLIDTALLYRPDPEMLTFTYALLITQPNGTQSTINLAKIPAQLSQVCCVQHMKQSRGMLRANELPAKSSPMFSRPHQIDRHV